MDIYSKILELHRAGRPVVLGMVIDAQGSTPQRAGSKALLDLDGRQWGTLGGGLVEAEGLNRMRAALDAGTPALLEYRLDQSYSRDAGPICGGVMRIFAVPNAEKHATAYADALDAVTERGRGVLATRLSPPESGSAAVAWVSEGEAGSHPIADQVAAILGGERAKVCTGTDGLEYFAEPVIPLPRLLVVGGGHVGQEVVAQAVRLGFEVSVLDDRPEFADPQLFPAGVHVMSGDMRSQVASFPQDDDSYIILVSKGHRPDAEALEGCIHGDARYIGMIGSRRKIRFLRKHFIEDGLATAEEFDRVVAPIGYDIGAITVPEIGVSIAAQLVSARRRNAVDARLHHRPATAETLV